MTKQKPKCIHCGAPTPASRLKHGTTCYDCHNYPERRLAVMKPLWDKFNFGRAPHAN